MRLRNISAAIAVTCVAALTISSCGSDAAKTKPSVADTTSTAATVTSSSQSPADTTATIATNSTDATDTTETGGSMDTTPATDAPTTTVATTTPPTEAPTTTIAPDALQDLPGIMPLSLTAGGTDRGRPTFSWIAPAGAASYQLIVQAADGTPVWGWTGVETTVPLGGVDRPAEVEGPTLSGPSRVRVYALDAADALIAISGWVSVAGT